MPSNANKSNEPNNTELSELKQDFKLFLQTQQQQQLLINQLLELQKTSQDAETITNYSDSTNSSYDKYRRQHEILEDTTSEKFQDPLLYAHYANKERRRQHKSVYSLTHETTSLYNRIIINPTPDSLEPLAAWAEANYAYLPLSALVYFSTKLDALRWKDSHINMLHPQQFLLWDKVFQESDLHVEYLKRNKDISWLTHNSQSNSQSNISLDRQHITVKTKVLTHNDFKNLTKFKDFKPFIQRFLSISPEELKAKGINLYGSPFIDQSLVVSYAGGTVEEQYIDLNLAFRQSLKLDYTHEHTSIIKDNTTWSKLVTQLYNQIQNTLSSSPDNDYISEELITIHAQFAVREEDTPQPVSTNDKTSRVYGLTQLKDGSYTEKYDPRQYESYEQHHGRLIRPGLRAPNKFSYRIERAVLIVRKSPKLGLRIDPMFIDSKEYEDRNYTVSKLMDIIMKRLADADITTDNYLKHLWNNIDEFGNINNDPFYGTKKIFIEMSDWEADKGGSDNTQDLKYSLVVPTGKIIIRKHSIIHVGGSNKYNTCPISYIIKLMQDIASKEVNIIKPNGEIIQPELRQILKVKDKYYETVINLKHYSTTLLIPTSNTSSQDCFLSALELLAPKGKTIDNSINEARRRANKTKSMTRKAGIASYIADFRNWVRRDVTHGITPTEAMNYVSDISKQTIALDLYNLEGRSHIGPSSNATVERIQMLFYDNHYVAIKQVTDINPVVTPVITEYDDNTEETTQSYYCFFDYETVNTPGEFTLPYSISWSLYKILPTSVNSNQCVRLSKTLQMQHIHDEFIYTPEPGHNKTTSVMINKIYTLVSNTRKTTVKMIAWNGSRFDFPILLTGMESNGLISVLSTPGLSPTGRLSEAKVELDSVLFHFWDPKNFVINSLERAAKVYSCEHDYFHIKNQSVNKFEFDHDIVQKEYDKTGKVDNSDYFVNKLKEYNMQDVKLLASTVTGMFRSFCESNVSSDISSTRSIAALTFKRLKTMGLEQGYHYKACHNIDNTPDKKADCFIRQAIVAGRVSNLTGKQGVWSFDDETKVGLRATQLLLNYEVPVTTVRSSKAVKVDVKSLYPSVAIKHKYPDTGKNGTNWFFTKEYSGTYDGMKLTELMSLGMFIIELDNIVWNSFEDTGLSITLKRSGVPMPCPIPTRGDTLNWFGYPSKCVTTSVTLQDCIDSKMIKSCNVLEMLVFPECDYLLKNYMLTAKKLKEDNDDVTNGGNPLLREVGKHCLNDPTGKLIQKQRKYQWKLKCGKLDTKITPNVIETKLSPSANLWIKEESNRLQNIPAQIGVFVYAWARSLMWKSVFSHYPVYYSDTDSAILRNRDYENLVKRGLCGNEFGKFEVEDDDIKMVMIQGPKAYCAVNTNKSYKDEINQLKSCCFKDCDENLPNTLMFDSFEEYDMCETCLECIKVVSNSKINCDSHFKGIRKDDIVTIVPIDKDYESVRLTFKDDSFEIFCALLSPMVDNVTADTSMFINKNGLKHQKIEKKIK